MSYSSTTATFTGGVEGIAVVGAINQTAIVGVGTTQGSGPTLVGGLNFVSTAASQTSVNLPAFWPFTSPLIVTCTTATTAVVFPTTGGQINGGSANASYSIAQGKAVAFFFAGNPTGSAPQWVAVGA